MAYTIDEHDGMFDVLDDGLMMSRNYKSREDAEAEIYNLQRGDMIGEVVDAYIYSAVTALMSRFGLSNVEARKAIKDALL